MYRIFTVEEIEFKGDDYNDASIFESYEMAARKRLMDYIKKGKINGSELRDDWFPTVNCDVFISHSHRDRELAVKFANWLHIRFGLNPFIDSCIWGYANELLGEIDAVSCKTGPNSYSYEKRNGTTSHVHMMLATALGVMLDKTECVFFLNTPNSISNNDVIDEKKTSSPWIYYELSSIRTMRRCLRRSKAANFSGSEKRALASLAENVSIEYDVSFKGIQKLGADELKNWRLTSADNPNHHALDVLYELFPDLIDDHCEL